jgi:hypothetical protein
LQLQRGECPDNDQCEAASLIDSFPFLQSASNSLATAEGYGSVAASCYIIDGQAKTLWYEFIGDGSCVSAAVTGEDFDAVLALYEGDDCDGVICVAQSENNRYTGNLLSLRTVSGTTYKVAVAGAYGASAGEYQLVIAVSGLYVHSGVKCALSLCQHLHLFVPVHPRSLTIVQRSQRTIDAKAHLAFQFFLSRTRAVPKPRPPSFRFRTLTTV